jgi:uncharacterized protein YfdQ (DUF2303 family)
MPSTELTALPSSGADTFVALDQIAEKKNAIDIVELRDPRFEDGLVGFAASVPVGRKLTSIVPLLDEYLDHPRRRRGTATLLTTEAFTAHVARFASATKSLIFADPKPAAPSLTAVYDYHEVGDAGDPNWCEHRATLALRMSDEWKAWLAVHEQDLAQGDFAAFLADHIGDVIVVDTGETRIADMAALLGARVGGAQQVMKLSRGIEVRQQIAVKNAVTLETGEVTVQFAENQAGEDGGPLTTPTLFFITIPVFYAGAPYQIPVRIRYRIRGGALIWSLHLYRHDRVFEDAFAGVLKQVREATDIPVLLGSPEK